MFRDYGDKVDFFYVYKTVEHPGINGFVEPFSIEERLKHVAIAKDRLKSEIPWLCDSMENDVKDFFGKAPNGEFVIGPDGKIVRKRFWSDANTLRADLEELVGKSETLTLPEQTGTQFAAQTFNSNDVASGVVPEIELPRKLRAIRIEPAESEIPFYAKLRVEATPTITRGGGELYFLLSLDPIHEMHWNNAAGKVRIELSETEGLKFSSEVLESAPVDAKADIDPRPFLIKLRSATATEESSFVAKVFYTVCDNAGTACLNVEQEYRIYLDFVSSGGTRPGIFMIKMFQDIDEWDKNGDGLITLDELPKPQAKLIMNHLDYSANGSVDKDEIDRFLKMFNNGNGIGRSDGPPAEESSEKESSEAKSAEEEPTVEGPSDGDLSREDSTGK